MPSRARHTFYLLVTLLALCAAGKAVLFDTMDPDCFWHLTVGEQLRAGGVGLLTDRLSFASSKEPWAPYSWLAELGMRSLWDHGGYRFGVLAHALMSGMFAVLLAITASRPSPGGVDSFTRPATLPAGERPPLEPFEPSKLSAVLATVFGLYLSLPYLSFRPATLALCLLAVAYYVIERDRARPSRRVYLLVPLTAVLANVHLFALLVPLWVGAIFLGDVIECALGRGWKGRGTRTRPASGPAKCSGRRALFVFVHTALASVATPLLPGVIRTAVHYQFADAMVAGPVIAEMQPFYRGPLGPLTVALLVAAFACIGFHRRRLGPADWLLLAGSTVLLFLHGRYAPLFAIVATPLLARTLPRLSDNVLGKPILRAGLAALLLMIVARLALAFPTAATAEAEWLNRHGPETPGYPAAAADYVAAHPLRRGGRLITEFTWGGYVEYRLGREYQVLLDGRTQLFTPAFWQATYLGPTDGLPGFLDRQQADAAILPRGGSRFKPALLSLGWVTVYADDRAEVLIPASPVAAAPEN